MQQVFSQKVFAPAVFLMCSLFSCNTTDLSSVSRVAEMIEGTYELTLVSWEGDALDVNGDGVASNNLYADLLSLPINAENDHRAVVESLSQDRTSGYIKMQIPLQNVNVTDDGRYPTVWMIGSRITVGLFYQIDSEGDIAVEHFDSMKVNEDDARLEIRKMHNGVVWFNEKGHLCFKAIYTFYDHAKAQLVEGNILYAFEKIKKQF